MVSAGAQTAEHLEASWRTATDPPGLKMPVEASRASDPDASIANAALAAFQAGPTGRRPEGKTKKSTGGILQPIWPGSDFGCRGD